MFQSNLTRVQIPPADLADIKAALNTLTSKLFPHLIALSNDDRRGLPKMGDKTQRFVDKALEYASQNPELVPSFLDMPNFLLDMQTIDMLASLQRQLNPLALNLDDSLLHSRSEAYQAALIFYRHVKEAQRANAPNAKSLYEDLSARFPSRGGQDATPEPDPEPTP